MKPKARTMFCWYCSRKLYAGGRQYITITGDDGHEHDVHKQCHDEQMADAEREALDDMRARGVSIDVPSAAGFTMGTGAAVPKER